MFRNDIGGTLSRFDDPDWDPLVALVGEDLAPWFMWMHAIELEDGEAVHAYKHVATRGYVHLGETGGAFAFCEGRYRPIPPYRAIQEVFAGWESLLPAPDDIVAHAALLRAATRRAEQLDEGALSAELCRRSRSTGPDASAEPPRRSGSRASATARSSSSRTDATARRSSPRRLRPPGPSPARPSA
jgi:hypothetical protein